MKNLLILFAILSASIGFTQDLKIKHNQGGLFSVGVRSTMSVFEHKTLGVGGLGLGGQFRLQLSNYISTEWFADYMRGNIDNLAERSDYHIGWSVMAYFTDKVAPPVKPYIVVGHCFDKTVLIDNADRDHRISKGSSAIQAGAGVHFNLTERFDITFLAQYMFHLGADVHAHVENGEIMLHRTQGTGIEGHLLLNLGINYKIADLWEAGKKKK